MAVDQSQGSNNELVIQDDNAQSEYIPAICAHVEENCDQHIADNAVESIETNAMKEMRGMELLFYILIINCSIAIS